MKTPKVPPTAGVVKLARSVSGLSQREASRAIFGADSNRSFQNWESGKRQMQMGTYIFFLVMTGQLTLEQAKEAVK